MNKLLALGVAAGFAAIAAIGISDAAQQPAPTAVVTGGQIRGATIDGQAVFLGVPYTAPPIGELRWREPQPIKAWTGVKDTTEFSPSCMQTVDFGPMSEDCLTLNIWAPEWPWQAPRPVMVWFHGGGDTNGGTNTVYFFGDSLAKQGVIVVTVNYRLGAFGFLALPELSAESPHKASGNYGLLDQIAALKWVKENIAQFGGDPNKVTIFGQSAGAQNVQRLMVSPLSKGLFQRAIAQSGALRRVDPTLAEMERQCTQVVARLRPPAATRLPFLRRAAARDILEAFDDTGGLCRPINLDGYVLPEQAFTAWANGRQHPVPYMGGNVARESYDEMSFAELKQNITLKYGEAAPRAFELYGLTGANAPAPQPIYGHAYQQWGADHNNRCRVIWQGRQHHAAGQQFYQYQFERNLPGQSPVSNMHSNDVPFVFGVVAHPRFAARFNDVERRTMDQMQRYWANFARNGDPNGEGLPPWRNYEPEGRHYMQFGENGATPLRGLRNPQCDLFLEVEKARPTAAHPERSARW